MTASGLSLTVMFERGVQRSQAAGVACAAGQSATAFCQKPSFNQAVLAAFCGSRASSYLWQQVHLLQVRGSLRDGCVLPPTVAGPACIQAPSVAQHG
jgi:hypothetical protein